MSYLEKALLKKRQELQELVNLLSETTKNTEEIKGRLRISHCRNVPQYFYCDYEQPENHKGTYIPQKDIQFAKKLAQSEYDRKLLEKARKELNIIQNVISRYQPDNLYSVYDKMTSSRQDIIESRIKSDIQYRAEWEAVSYTGNSFENSRNEIYSDRGERVRSKSEKIIADMLLKMNIPYKYECPLYLKGKGIVYPDFTVLCMSRREEMYYEHFGMMDDAGYVNRNLPKIDFYERNGYLLGDRLFVTFETTEQPLSTENLRILLKRFI